MIRVVNTDGLSSANYLRIVFFFQAEDGIRDRDVTGVQTVLFRSLQRSHSVNRLLLASTQAPPPSAFLRLLRASSSPNPTVLFHTAHTHGILTLQGFPSTRTPPGSSPFGTFSAFLLRSEELRPRSQGFASRVAPFLAAEYCIYTQLVTLLSF